MKDYTKFMKWALVYMIDRKTQDDRKSKLIVEGLFSSPSQIKDNYIIRNTENKRYIISVDDLEEFENVYNGFQDLRERYGEHAIFCLEELKLSCDKENKWRQILGVYTEIDFKKKIARPGGYEGRKDKIMTKQEMQNKLDRKDISGVGVKVTFNFSSGETGVIYYFYEDFENDKGVDRAAKHFSDLINKGKVRKAEYIYS